MKFGLFGLGSGVADPDTITTVAQAAEAAGLESLWTGEHVVLPKPRTADSPADPDLPFLHPSAILSYLAAVTNRVLLGTGVVLIAQRNPVVLAKEIASADVLSGGRAVLGVGAGYLESEFAALGADFPTRGARTDEAIDVLRRLWSDPDPSFKGEFNSFAGIDAHPRPVQAGGVPIVIGGHSRAALRRAVLRGHGWYGWAQTPKQTRGVLAQLGEIASAAQRPHELGELEITITPPARLTPEAVEDYAESGVHRLISLMPRQEVGMLHTIELLHTLSG